MNRNKVVLVSALTAAALGVAGLAAIAVPAGAGTQPSLPEVSAEELVTSALSTHPPALAGRIAVDNALGLPMIPGLPTQLGDGSSDVSVWYDGDGRSRVSLPNGAAERVIVDDGTTVWHWDSAERTVVKAQHDADREPKADTPFDPAAVAKEVLNLVRPTSVISVDGTALVAERPAYELVLAPAPTERTLLREVRVAIDSETRMPLRLVVLTNGTDEPVFSVGFEELTVGAQDAGLFTFTPPAGAEVTEDDQADRRGPGTGRDEGGPLANLAGPDLFGDGWDTVVLGTLPKDLFGGERGGERGDDPDANRPGGPGFDPRAFLDRIGTPVSGDWGSGRLISTAVVSVVITDDGRVAAGAVPQQVLVEALSR
ncbi:MAG TPA: hypothetical protein VGD67_18800 [Pseudonocardiaceae bacterium]